MTFKDVIAQDIKRTFLNFDEFGTIHKLNGRDTLVIVDDNEMTEREKKFKNAGALNGFNGGLFKKQLLFYVHAKDFGPLPSPGRTFHFDKQEYLITDAVDEDGIYSISLEATRS
ncbi:MAG: hypothetical protein HDR71_15390 [Lachnospiraceae bacterium]|nr:hypothetical protein [Lachnospiraceae bacterium]